ncbi:MAG: acyl-ACP--UDP-N-acetylglucosamine O-acyltransferase [Candidatus Melainabacteria bacterium]|nr:acyl-ACP--UDP-N-acetylglucosamine O-acyltransferase [Candidatus Melainabacteria bacterium]
MGNRIHPTAMIDPDAILADDITVGPYAIIGPQVVVGAGTTIQAHAVLESHVRVGENCLISSGAIIGGLPQDHRFQGEPSHVWVGNHVQVREFVTIHRATGENAVTRVGDHCLLMAYSHVGHNCQVGQHVVMANCSQLGGHVEIGDYAVLGGTAVVHQFCRIGRMAMLGGFSGTRQDIPPFMLADGMPATVKRLNVIALRRREVDATSRNLIKQTFNLLFRSPMNTQQALSAIEDTLPANPYVEEIVRFMTTSNRGVSRKKDGDRLNAETSLAEMM